MKFDLRITAIYFTGYVIGLACAHAKGATDWALYAVGTILIAFYSSRWTVERPTGERA